MYMEKRISNPLEKRRRNNRKTQAEVAKFLGITQSQYSRLENAECSPEPYLAKLAEFFNCKENELYAGNILVELENDFLNDGFKQVGGTYHEKKPDHIYLNIKGWFPNHIAQEAIDYLTEHMEAEVRKEQSVLIPVSIVLMPSPCTASMSILQHHLGMIVVHFAANQLLN